MLKQTQLPRKFVSYDNGQIHPIGSLYNSWCCVTMNLNTLPSTITNTNSFNPATTITIFKCGGWMLDTCHALIIDTESFNTSHYKLPKLTTSWNWGNSLCFSESQQLLINVGGNGSSAFTVSGLSLKEGFIDEQNNTNTDTDTERSEWKWYNIAELDKRRYNPSSIVINKYDKLFVIGGESLELESANIKFNSGVIYDLCKNEWKEAPKDCMHARASAGICCDEWMDRIYFGGGIDDESYGKSMEWYDFNKNEWNLTKIPDTNNAHKEDPVIWVQDHYLLYIASFHGNDTYSSNSCEWIDLRVCDKWNIAVKDKLLDHVFGIDDNVSRDDCLLVV